MVQIHYTAGGILRSHAVFCGLWSKVLCRLSSLSDLNNLPHALHTKVWAILTRGLTLSPLSVVGPILDADIFLNGSLGAIWDLCDTKTDSTIASLKDVRTPVR